MGWTRGSVGSKIVSMADPSSADLYPQLLKGRAIRAAFTFVPDAPADAPDPDEVVCDLARLRETVVVIDGRADAQLDNSTDV